MNVADNDVYWKIVGRNTHNFTKEDETVMKTLEQIDQGRAKLVYIIVT